MAQPIERILVRHLGSRLAVPLFLVDTEGTLVFYNEAAEALLGRRFEEAGEMTFDDWTTAFAVRDAEGQPIAIDEIALVKALREGRPAYSRVDITGMDGATRSLEVAAFPLQGQGATQLGAVALFWEVDGR